MAVSPVPTDLAVCTCGACDAREAVNAWQRRATPVIARLVAHGHCVNYPNMLETLRLVTLLEQDVEAIHAPENRHRSHHAIGCPASARGFRPPRKMKQVVASAQRVEEWLSSFNAFVREQAVQAQR